MTPIFQQNLNLPAQPAQSVQQTPAMPTPTAPNTASTPDGLDPKVVALARAIRQTESNNNYDAVGDGGHSIGAYQWYDPSGNGKAHFEAEAKNFGLDPNDFSPVNQDRVAYAKIKSQKDQGYHADEIAAMWNGARMENGRPVANNPAYITKVGTALQQQQGHNFNPNPYGTGQGQINLNTPTPPQAGGGVNQTDVDNTIKSAVGGGELTAATTGIRAIQGLPALARTVYDAVTKNPNLQKDYNQSQVIQQPLWGQKTFAGSSNRENLDTSAGLLLQAGGVKASGLLGKAVKAVLPGSSHGILGNIVRYEIEKNLAKHLPIPLLKTLLSDLP